MALPAIQVASMTASGGLTSKERINLAAVNVGASSLSLVGSAFIVLCYILFKELRTFSFKLVFYLALSDMFCSFFTIIGDPSNGFFCYAQDYSAHFFCLSSFLWTTIIAFTLYRTVVKHKADIEDLGAMFHLYVWGTSLVMTVIRSIGNDYGHLGMSEGAHTGKVCKLFLSINIQNDMFNQHNHIYHDSISVFFYFTAGSSLHNILCSSFGCNSLQWIHVFPSNSHAEQCKMDAVGMSDRPYQVDSRMNMKALQRWGYYPLILIGSWIFGTINRVYDFVYPAHRLFWLSVLDVGFVALMGLFNSIAYGLNSSVRRAIFERLELWLPERLRNGFLQSSEASNRRAS